MEKKKGEFIPGPRLGTKVGLSRLELRNRRLYLPTSPHGYFRGSEWAVEPGREPLRMRPPYIREWEMARSIRFAVSIVFLDILTGIQPES
jgi:hypothetical protein